MKVRGVGYVEARSFVGKHHYLHTLPKTVKDNFGGFDLDRLIAVASYGPVHSAKSPDGWLELRRLVRAPDWDGQLSSFLARTLRALKDRGVPAVLSWADQAAGHHGGIYQATNFVYTEPYTYNWNYNFRRADGSVIDHRQAFALFGTSSKAKVLALDSTLEAFLPPMKLRYLMPLNMKKADCLEAIKAKERPYPKPDRAALPIRIGSERRREFLANGIS